jgi:hypothetical protein
MMRALCISKAVEYRDVVVAWLVVEHMRVRESMLIMMRLKNLNWEKIR